MIRGDDPAPVDIEHVAGRIRVPMLEQGRPDPEPWRGVDVAPVDADGSALSRPHLTLGDRALRELEIAGAVAVALAIPAAGLTGDVRTGSVLAALVGAAAGVRSIDRHVGFSFGEGFSGYRSDMGWPRGVQEENEVHFHLRSDAASGGDRGI